MKKRKDEMTAAEFIELGRQIYGGHGWKTKLAKDVGKSFSAIKRMSYGDAKIQKLMADFLRAKAREGKV